MKRTYIIAIKSEEALLYKYFKGKLMDISERGTASAPIKRIIQKLKNQNWKKPLTSAKHRAYAVLHHVETLLKRYPVGISLGSFFFFLGLFVKYHYKVTYQLTIASFGTIFVALGYRLSQANYHKDLFKDRFAIFSVIDEVMQECGADIKATREMVTRLNEIMRKSHCLFGEQTYQFIKEFRKAIITLAYLGESQPEHEKVIEASNFIISLVNNENLPKKFSELKIDSY